MRLTRSALQNIIALGICLLAWRLVSLFLMYDVERLLDWVMGRAPDIVDWLDLVYFFLSGILACVVAARTARYLNRAKSVFLAFAPPVIIAILSHELLYSTDWDIIWPYVSVAYVVVQIVSYLVGYWWPVSSEKVSV